MEEGGLLGTETGVLSGNDDAQRGDGTVTGRSPDLVLDKFVPDLDEVTAGENETYVALDVGEKFLQGGVTLDVTADRLSHHRVLSHEHDRVATERHTDLLHLLRADIVRTHNKALGIVVQKLLQRRMKNCYSVSNNNTIRNFHS